jgi:hypothetical protein
VKDAVGSAIKPVQVDVDKLNGHSVRDIQLLAITMAEKLYRTLVIARGSRRLSCQNSLMHRVAPSSGFANQPPADARSASFAGRMLDASPLGSAATVTCRWLPHFIELLDEESVFTASTAVMDD